MGLCVFSLRNSPAMIVRICTNVKKWYALYILLCSYYLSNDRNDMICISLYINKYIHHDKGDIYPASPSKDATVKKRHLRAAQADTKISFKAHRLSALLIKLNVSFDSTEFIFPLCEPIYCSPNQECYQI